MMHKVQFKNITVIAGTWPSFTFLYLSPYNSSTSYSHLFFLIFFYTHKQAHKCWIMDECGDIVMMDFVRYTQSHPLKGCPSSCCVEFTFSHLTFTQRLMTAWSSVSLLLTLNSHHMDTDTDSTWGPARQSTHKQREEEEEKKTPPKYTCYCHKLLSSWAAQWRSGLHFLCTAEGCWFDSNWVFSCSLCTFWDSSFLQQSKNIHCRSISVSKLSLLPFLMQHIFRVTVLFYILKIHNNYFLLNNKKICDRGKERKDPKTD